MTEWRCKKCDRLLHYPEDAGSYFCNECSDPPQEGDTLRESIEKTERHIKSEINDKLNEAESIVEELAGCTLWDEETLCKLIVRAGRYVKKKAGV